MLSYALFIMLRSVFPGSFDPPTYGHINIIERAVEIFDELHIIVAVNREKKYLFSPEERVAMMRNLVSHWSNVHVDMWDSLIVNYLSKENIKVLIRGVRGVSDFAYEFDLSMMNKGLNPSIETIFMTTDPKYFILRSSAIKELASFGGDVSTMVPPIVAEALKKKYDRASF